MTDREFIDQVALLAERAAAVEGDRSDLFSALAYLDGGLLPLDNALEGLQFDALFVEVLNLLIDGVEPVKVWFLYDAAAKMRLSALEQRLALQRQALQLLAAGADARLIRTLLNKTLHLGSVLVAEPIQPRA